MHREATSVISQAQLTTLMQRLGSDNLELPPLFDDDRRDICWARLAAGRLMLIEQLDRNGQRLVILAPCPEASSRALTAIEGRIARLAGQALSNKQIAVSLRMSSTAVENHLSRALRKLGLCDRVALARLYTQLEAIGRL